ncbi:MAG: DUF4870 domain-containing protein [Symploca sp. SIO3C6]|uniref:DUF4870 domain-containing protein n=1 Tax=Symploca sp. SIO1C4 TaxID=2607765 RepID=A0A6B3NLK0_9CYAN|nr:DUF4870 domain-containing protein [Symploca sp. SIO3C6]NER30451.1 DUF4870 domain-containing protein [Symploca sp. SIO1C4]
MVYDQNKSLETDQDKRKLLSALCHGSIFISTLVVSIGIPIAILLVSEDSVVKENAKEAINFHLNVWLYGGIIAALSFLTFGLLGLILLPLFFLFNWIPPILAIIKSLSEPNQSYRYPFIFHLL